MFHLCIWCVGVISTSLFLSFPRASRFFFFLKKKLSIGQALKLSGLSGYTIQDLKAIARSLSSADSITLLKCKGVPFSQDATEELSIGIIEVISVSVSDSFFFVGGCIDPYIYIYTYCFVCL